LFTGNNVADLLLGYLTMLCRERDRTLMAEKLQDNKLERAWKKKAMLSFEVL
jgi:hypothetical protein